MLIWNNAPYAQLSLLNRNHSYEMQFSLEQRTNMVSYCDSAMRLKHDVMLEKLLKIIYFC